MLDEKTCCEDVVAYDQLTTIGCIVSSYTVVGRQWEFPHVTFILQANDLTHREMDTQRNVFCWLSG